MAQDMCLEQVLTRQQDELRTVGWQPPTAAPEEQPQAVVARFQSRVWDDSGDSGVRDLLLHYARRGNAMPMGLVLSLANDHGCSMTLAFFNKLLFTISTSGNLEASYTVLQWMSAWGHQPDISSYSHVLVTAVACFDAATVLHIARHMRDDDMVPTGELLRHALLIIDARLHWGTSSQRLELRRALAIHQEIWLHFLLAVGVPMYSSALKLVVGQVARGLEGLQLEPLPATAEWVAYAARCPWALDSEEAWVHPEATRASSVSQLDAFGVEVPLMARVTAAARCQGPTHGPAAKFEEFETAQSVGHSVTWRGSEAHARLGSEPKDHWTHAVSMAWACTDEDTDEYDNSDNTEAYEDVAALVAPSLPPGSGCDEQCPYLGCGLAQHAPPPSSAVASSPHQPASASGLSKASRGRRSQLRFAAQADIQEVGADEAFEAGSTEDQSLRRCYLKWLHEQPRTQQESLYNAYQKWQVDRIRQRASSAPAAPPSTRSASF